MTILCPENKERNVSSQLRLTLHNGKLSTRDYKVAVKIDLQPQQQPQSYFLEMEILHPANKQRKAFNLNKDLSYIMIIYQRL
jgi:hypothetical protein